MMTLIKQSRFLLCLFLFGVLLSMKAIIAQSDSLSLRQIIAMAQGESFDAFDAQNSLSQAEMDYKAFQANYRPQLQLNGSIPNFINTFSQITQPDGSISFERISYNNSSLSAQLTQNIAATGGTFFMQSDLQRYDDFAKDFRTYNGIPVRIGYVQELSAFNRFKWEKKIAPVQLSEAQKQMLFDREAISVDALSRFFVLLIAQIDLQIATANQQSNQSLYDIAKERYELGKISENDLLQLRLELVNAGRDASDAQQAVRDARLDLQTFLGKDGGAEWALRVPAEIATMDVKVAEAIRLARENRPELDGFTRRRLQAQRDVAQTKRNFGFQADLQASLGFARGSEVLSEIYSNPQQEQNVSLQLAIPILDWGRRKANVRQAKLIQENVSRSIAQENVAFDNDIRSLVSAFQQLQQSIPLSKEGREIALRRFAISKDRYLMGDISTTDLTIAIAAKDQAQRAYVFALRNYWQTYYQLRQLTLYDFINNQNIR
ncbi:MAG: TolC family protein [Bacteroidota bacterium]